MNLSASASSLNVVLFLLFITAAIVAAVRWQEARDLQRTLSAVMHRISEHPLAYFGWTESAPHRPGLWLFIYRSAEGTPKRTQLELTTHRSRASIEGEIGGPILLTLGPLPYAGAALKALGDKRLPSREEAAQGA